MTNKELEQLVVNAMDIRLVYDNIADNLDWMISEGNIDKSEYNELFAQAAALVEAKVGGTQ